MAEYSKKYRKEKNAMTVPAEWIYSTLFTRRYWVREEYCSHRVAGLLVMSFAMVVGLDCRLRLEVVNLSDERSK